MRLVPLLLLALACDAPEPVDTAPLPLAGPPAGVRLFHTPLRGGGTAQAWVDVGRVGVEVQLAGGLAAGSTCPAWAGGACFDLDRPLMSLGTATSDADGYAHLVFDVPPVGSPSTVQLQAVHATGPLDERSAITPASITPADPSNTPPSTGTPQLSPADPTAGTRLRCSPSGTSDADGDAVGFAWRWTVDGVDVGHPFPFLRVDDVGRGSVIACAITPTDGQDEGAAAASAAVVVANTPPSLRGAVLAPATPEAGDVPTCAGLALEDADGDPVAVLVQWSVNGVPSGSGSSLGVPLSEGDVVSCTATPHDGLDAGPAATVTATTAPAGPPPNVLVVMMDDVGIDKVGLYGVDPAAPPTPTIDAIAARGVRFERAYAQPVCTPTRAAALTGRHALRVELGKAVAYMSSRHDLDLAETTMAEVLGPAGWGTGAFGKWHLNADRVGGPGHPNDQGFDRFEGSNSNFYSTSSTTGADQDFFSWEENVDGQLAFVQRYATTETVDDALAWIQASSEPWFVWLSFHAPHQPWHTPPQALHSYGTGLSNAKDRYDADLEALDTELGRLLATLPADEVDRTVVIVLGDNGTPGPTTRVLDPDRVKGTLYEGGVRVPMVAAGPGIAPGGVTDVWTHVVDLFPTVMELARVPLDPAVAAGLDGRSLAPWLADPSLPTDRDGVYADYFGLGPPPWSDARRMARDDTWRLIEDASAPPQLFRVGADIDDGVDRLRNGTPPTPAEHAAMERLRDLMATLVP